MIFVRRMGKGIYNQSDGADAMTRGDKNRTFVEAWLRAAVEDAERRGLPEFKPLLEGLAHSTLMLRAADWNDYVPGGGQAEGGEAEGLP
jgi:hypothetical protein